MLHIELQLSGAFPYAIQCITHVFPFRVVSIAEDFGREVRAFMTRERANSESPIELLNRMRSR